MNIGYESTQKQKQIAGACFTIRSLSPCYPAEERKLVKRDIENKLYYIFCKYCRT